jgi:transcriptional regulator with XRE-family HTH domain
MTSEEFRALRLQLGLTQVELGDKMGIRQEHISRIENGERQPTKIQAAFIRYILLKESSLAQDS